MKLLLVGLDTKTLAELKKKKKKRNRREKTLQQQTTKRQTSMHLSCLSWRERCHLKWHQWCLEPVRMLQDSIIMCLLSYGLPCVSTVCRWETVDWAHIKADVELWMRLKMLVSGVGFVGILFCFVVGFCCCFNDDWLRSVIPSDTTWASFSEGIKELQFSWSLQFRFSGTIR